MEIKNVNAVLESRIHAIVDAENELFYRKYKEELNSIQDHYNMGMLTVAEFMGQNMSLLNTYNNYLTQIH